MARPRGARRISESDERESCNNVSGLLVEQFCSGPTWVSARIQADYRQDLSGPFWHPVSWLRRADRSSISSFHLADLGGKAIDIEVSRSLFSSFDVRWRRCSADRRDRAREPHRRHLTSNEENRDRLTSISIAF